MKDTNKSTEQIKQFKKHVTNYIKQLNKKERNEHNLRSVLKDFLEKIVVSDIEITDEPKQIDTSNKPDLLVHRKSIDVGYIETKNIDIDLEKEENKKNKNGRIQIEEYKKNYPNLIFTNYKDFWFYRDSELKDKISIANINENNKIELIKDKDKIEQFYDLIYYFLDYKSEITNPKELADKMANIAKLIKKAMTDQFKDNKNLVGLYNEFKKELISSIKVDEFIDLYTQTIVYGLFAARINQQDNFINEDFKKENIRNLLPKSNPFLTELFKFILDKEDENNNLTGYISDLIDIFAKTELLSILNNSYKKNEYKYNDPIVYFYEDFLGEYNPQQKTDLGVWYTPKPIVNFIIRAIDYVLQNDLKIYNGLLNNDKIKVKNSDGSITEKPKVQILDPATGTGTFLAELVQYMYDKIKEEGQEGTWNGNVKNNIIPRLNAFEILMVSYTIAHLKLEMKFRETGYNINQGERLNIYLTDSLENPKKEVEPNFFAEWIPNEINQANNIKNNTPIMVVLGNPPYNNFNADEDKKNNNNNDWIDKLIDDYRFKPNSQERLSLETKLNLKDDYVKFIRLGEYFIEKNKTGILAYINPHGFLDNDSFCGMRWKLLKTFDKIYTINLHGNIRRIENTSKKIIDQNVFDNITQGVSINIFVKVGTNNQQPTTNNQQPTTNNQQPNGLAEVFYCDLEGKRKTKFEFLNSKTINSIDWKKIEYQTDSELFTPLYLFTPQEFLINPIDEDAKQTKRDYYTGFALNNLVITYKKNSGIDTGNDNFTIHFNSSELRNKIEKLIDIKDNDEAKTILKLEDSAAWNVISAREVLEKNYPDKGGSIIEINYRPFDYRTTFYTKHKGFLQAPRYNIMQHILNSKEENIGLCLCSKVRSGNTYQHIFISDKVIGRGFVSNQSSETTFLFPLYLYNEDGSRIPNIKDKTIIKEIENKTGLKFTPEKEEDNNTFVPIDLMDYIYAVLHCPNYREKYIKLLKKEFPKIPYPKDQKEFKTLSSIGSKLRSLHLLKDDVINEIKINISFPEHGDDQVKIGKNENVKYINNKVYINKEQYFDNISDEVFNFKIGCYQPVQKWLKDRNGRKLDYDEKIHYQKIIKSIYETINIMNNELKDIEF